MQKGKQSLCFTEAPFNISTANIVGKKEGEGPLAGHFDVIGEDDKFGQNTWEEAESTLQKEAFTMAVGRAGLKKEDIRYLFAGDLLWQTMATSFGVLDFQVPLFGLYGACSTCGESLSLGAMCVAAGYADHVVTMTSSHFASAEKQFRFPLEYANQRPKSATWTVTGSAAFVLGKERGMAKITEITAGNIVEYGIKDSMNMGAAMAPAAKEVIRQHFEVFGRSELEYDRFITGYLGTVGEKTYAFIGLERIGGVMAYDITNPDKILFANYINSRDFSKDIAGDVSPDGLCMISASECADGNAYLLASCEVSGTVAAYKLISQNIDSSDDDNTDNNHDNNIDHNGSGHGGADTEDLNNQESKTNALKTGDHAPVIGTGIGMVLALSAIIVILKYRRSKNTITNTK